MYSAHLHIGSELLAKLLEPNAHCSLDILLTRLSFAEMPKPEKGW